MNQSPDYSRSNMKTLPKSFIETELIKELRDWYIDQEIREYKMNIMLKTIQGLEDEPTKL